MEKDARGTSKRLLYPCLSDPRISFNPAKTPLKRSSATKPPHEWQILEMYQAKYVSEHIFFSKTGITQGKISYPRLATKLCFKSLLKICLFQWQKRQLLTTLLLDQQMIWKHHINRLSLVDKMKSIWIHLRSKRTVVLLLGKSLITCVQHRPFGSIGSKSIVLGPRGRTLAYQRLVIRDWPSWSVSCQRLSKSERWGLYCRSGSDTLG